MCTDGLANVGLGSLDGQCIELRTYIIINMVNLLLVHLFILSFTHCHKGSQLIGSLCL